MNRNHHDAPPPTDPLDHLAAFIRRQGLTTPALLILGIVRPLGFVAGQCLALVQPIVPEARWQARIGQMAADLEDEATWTRLENLLQ